MDISILIPTMHSRRNLFEQVLKEVERQIRTTPEIKVEVLWNADNGELTLGQKRNVLMDQCRGKYHCFIDDDDVLAPYFLKTFVPMIRSGIDYDCASFVGAHYHNGQLKKLFNHSIIYKEWFEMPERYYRCPSPMNLIKTSVVRQVRYRDIRNTEDHEFSMRLMRSGLLNNEFQVNPNRPLYHYIDGVKEDREKWDYEWIGDFLRLYRRPDNDKFNIHASEKANPLPYLKLSRG
jgi:glycosyltransferase involved in cell wall biosynthesis